ncbi:hypothetical protein R4144_13400, partial [Gordonia amicalis]|nr:hypothetical protein [Gordonia amicalis]
MTDDARYAAEQAGAGFSPTSTPTDLLIRPLQPADQASVVALHQQMGDRETYFRFFALRPGDLAVLAADICVSFATVKGPPGLIVCHRDGTTWIAS